MALKLFRFHYFDPRKRKWLRARYVASIDEIVARNQPFQIVGPPEVRQGEGLCHFAPFPYVDPIEAKSTEKTDGKL